MTIRDLKRILFIAVIMMTGCSDSGPPTTTISSDDPRFGQLSDKVAYLEKYVSFRRSYEALDFMIFYRNNSGGLVPGPSDWNITVVAKVPASEIELWTKGLNATDPPKKAWVDRLPGSIGCAGVSSWFEEGGRLVGVDRERAVIVFRNSSM